MKKLLSFILAFAMLLSLVPTNVFAAKEVSPLSVTYSFTGSVELENEAGVKFYTDYEKNNDGTYARAWGYLGTNIAASISKSVFVSIDSDKVSAPATLENEWVAFKIMLPAAGTYSVSGSAYYRQSASKDMEIYLVPMSDTLKEKFAPNSDIYGDITVNSGDKSTRVDATGFDALGISDVQGAYIGAVNTYIAKNAEGWQTVKDFGTLENTVTATAGNLEYILLFNQGSSSGSARWLYPASLKLTMIETASALSSVTLSSDENVIRLGARPVKTSTTMYDSEGNIFLGKHTVEYSSNDTSVATIDDNGYITPVSAGTATISVVAAEDSEQISESTVSDSIEIEVAEGFGIGAYKYIFKTEAIRSSSNLIDLESGQVLYKNLFKISPEMLNSKSDPYSIVALNSCNPTHKADRTIMRNTGLEARFYTEKYSAGANEKPYAVLKISNIPAGVYYFSMFNEMPYSSGVVAKVFLNNEFDSGNMEEFYEDSLFVGWHDSTTKHDGTEEHPAEVFKIEIRETGDYYLCFVADEESWEKNKITGGSAADPIQMMSLSEIEFKTIFPLGNINIELDKTETHVSRSVETSVTVLDINGNEFLGEYTIAYLSSNPEIASVSNNGVITPHKAGNVKIIAVVKGKTSDSSDEVVIEKESETLVITEDAQLELFDGITAGGSKHIRLSTGEAQEPIPLWIKAYDNAGNWINTDDVKITVISLNPEYAYVDENLNIIPVACGDYDDYNSAKEAWFEVTIKYRGREISITDFLTVAYAKEESTFFTAEEAVNARENIEKYNWAKNEAKDSVEGADKWIEKVDFLYDSIISQGLPRLRQVGNINDPYSCWCAYCGTNLKLEHNVYGYFTDPVSRPWKVQCGECKRLFPSNDFGSFYELGLNEYGEFDRLRALVAHHEMIYHKDGVCTYKGKLSCGDIPKEDSSFEWLEYFGYGQGYLKNTTYTELYNGSEMDGLDPFFYNADTDGKDGADKKKIKIYGGYGNVKSGMLWGVDDGFGYVPLNEDGSQRYPTDNNGDPIISYEKQVMERKTFIGNYNFALWHSVGGSGSQTVLNAIEDCANAYFYTGDKKYGRVAAILLDRVADVWPELQYGEYWWMIGGIYFCGKYVDSTWTANKTASELLEAYDKIFDVYEKDNGIIEYLKQRGKTIKFRYSKETPSQLRTHVEDSIIRNCIEEIKRGHIHGNFGMNTKINAMCAVILDSMPESKEWLDYMMQPGRSNASSGEENFGGSVDEQIIDRFDADGMGDEGSDYNKNWFYNLIRIQNVLADYNRYKVVDLYNFPKYIQMHYSMIDIMSAGYTPQVGDTDYTLAMGHWLEPEMALQGYQNLDDKVTFAQMLYLLNDNSSNGLRYDITESNPERLADEVRTIINEHGEYKFKSKMMTNFGFAILRDGADFTASNNGTDTRMDTWMYFGTNSGSHPHLDTLNLGMTAFGLNFLPELAYPAETSQDPNRVQWVDVTLSHNTVVINDTPQKPNNEVRGKAKHFDEAGRVSLVDVSTPYVYKAKWPNKIKEYRRSLVQINTDDENAYVVDFFRVVGGEKHTYSFHATSNEITYTNGLDLDPQDGTPGDFVLDEKGYIGSYAGADVAYGNNPDVPSGHSWLKNIDWSKNPSNKIEINFKIKDFRNVLKDSAGLNLYMTMLNKSNYEHTTCNGMNVAIADGAPPPKSQNKVVDKYKFVLINNEGEELNTTFTTVFEPYRNERVVESIEELDMSVEGGAEGVEDAARALKVRHKNGEKTDYIFYATNGDVTYSITDGDLKLYFKGFVGVYTVNRAGEKVYTYLHDGEILGEANEPVEDKKAIEATVLEFTRQPCVTNEILIHPTNGALTENELADLTGRYVFIDNGEDVRSGTYEIVGASRDGENIVLDVGRITTIRKYVDPYNTAFDPTKPEATYVYMIDEGQSARIPLTISDDNSPVFDEINSGLSTSAGSSISVTVNAESPIENNPPKITYIGTTLPRGASINADTGTVTWKPDASQVGDNHFAVTAHDEAGRETTAYFTVTVYGSTTSKPATDNSAEAPSTNTSGGGGGGGGGGVAPAPEKEDTLVGDGGSDVPQDEDKTDDGENAPDASGETDIIRFTDLSNHSWAADAINVLAADGIIKGTSASTFSPDVNITRADFALLLVRAFKLDSDNTENFADVSASDYFAHELAIARNTGIVGGIGDNKFAPKSKITRQDMMVIVYRALSNLNVGLGDFNEPNYEDYAAVADYAKEAVSALIGAGLVNGKNGRIAPMDYTTRAEVAVLISRILEHITKE